MTMGSCNLQDGVSTSLMVLLYEHQCTHESKLQHCFTKFMSHICLTTVISRHVNLLFRLLFYTFSSFIKANDTNLVFFQKRKLQKCEAIQL